MKKYLTTVSAALLLSAAYSLDFGALLANDSNFTGNKMSELQLDQVDTASAWLKVPLSANSYFATEGMYRFEKKWIDLFDVEEKEKEAADESALDLSLAKFSLLLPAGSGSLAVSAGRFATSDATSVIYNQTADGLTITYATPYLNFSLYGAYTGLLNNRTVAMLNESGYAEDDPGKKYALAAKYAVAAVTSSFSNFVGSQTVTLQALGAWRLEGDSFNRMYATLAFNGPLLPRLFYTLSSTLGLRQYDGENELSNLSKATFAFYTNLKSLSLTAHALYASGSQGSLKAFESVTSQTAVKAFSGRTEYTELLRAGLAASIKPVRQLLLTAGGDVILDAAASTPAYEGFQWQANASWQIVSDVALCASAYQYFNNDDDQRNKSSIDLYAAISF